MASKPIIGCGQGKQGVVIVKFVPLKADRHLHTLRPLSSMQRPPLKHGLGLQVGRAKLDSGTSNPLTATDVKFSSVIGNDLIQQILSSRRRLLQPKFPSCISCRLHSYSTNFGHLFTELHLFDKDETVAPCPHNT